MPGLERGKSPRPDQYAVEERRPEAYPVPLQLPQLEGMSALHRCGRFEVVQVRLQEAPQGRIAEVGSGDGQHDPDASEAVYRPGYGLVRLGP